MKRIFIYLFCVSITLQSKFRQFLPLDHKTSSFVLFSPFNCPNKTTHHLLVTSSCLHGENYFDIVAIEDKINNFILFSLGILQDYPDQASCSQTDMSYPLLSPSAFLENLIKGARLLPVLQFIILSFTIWTFLMYIQYHLQEKRYLISVKHLFMNAMTFNLSTFTAIFTVAHTINYRKLKTIVEVGSR